MRKKEAPIQADAIYQEYTGKKVFHVSHPDHKQSLRISAPTEEAAIVAAAEYWNETWTEYRFYAWCSVVPG